MTRWRSGTGVPIKVSYVTGTLGAVREEDDGTLTAVLSGHVARRGGGLGARVEAMTGGSQFEIGKVTFFQHDGALDAALASPVPANTLPWLARSSPGLRTLRPEELPLDVVLRLPGTDRSTRSRVLHVNVPANFAEPGKPPKIMPGLLMLAHPTTKLGDSGAVAVDSQERIVGFVLGLGRLAGQPGAPLCTFLLPSERIP